jgi:hypothetical protein
VNKFYQVAGLKPGIEIIEEAHTIRVDLTFALHRPFSYNDDEILATRQRGEYVWASGGGTCLLNDRYLLVVQRDLHANVNPGKFSLFTGRADSTQELLRPSLLVRELFEELVLFSGKSIYRPYSSEVETNLIIDRIYSSLEENLGLDISTAEPLRIDHVLCSPKKIIVRNDSAQWVGILDCHVNSNGEINFLYIFSGYLDIDKLQAMDGEFYNVGDETIRNNRSIYLYDLQTENVRDITIDRRALEPIPISQGLMTEHLQHLVVSVKRKLNIGIPDWVGP